MRENSFKVYCDVNMKDYFDNTANIKIDGEKRGVK